MEKNQKIMMTTMMMMMMTMRMRMTRRRTMKRRRKDRPAACDRRDALRDEVRLVLADGLWILSQMPKVRVREMTIAVQTPHLLGLGDNPVIAEVKAGRLVARTQRKVRSGVLTFQWETAANEPRRKPAPMPLAEFLRSLEVA